MSAEHTHQGGGREGVVVVPPAQGWAAAGEPGQGPQQRRFREELGIAHDRPVIMSGHQAEVWHPGIAAKWFAMNALAKARGGQAVWVVVDQDTNDPTRTRYPTVDLKRGVLGPAQASTLPTGARAPITPAADAPADCAPEAREGLARLLAAVRARVDAPTLAAQYALASADLLGVHAQGVVLVHAGRLAGTRLFGAFVDAMKADRAILYAYNRAVIESGRAGGVRPLSDDPVRGHELPVWTVTQSGARRAAFAGDALRPGESLAPRALFMTALLRLAGCEIFIHGLGGGVYDRITDRWLELLRTGASREAETVLGNRPPGPTCVVTATRYLPLGGPALPAPETIAHMAWAAHRVLSDPSMLGDRTAATAKAAALVDIRGAATPQERVARYRAMHAGLERYRASHAALLAQVAERAADARGSLDAASVRYDRTWAFPLYGPRVMDDLSREVQDALRGA